AAGHHRAQQPGRGRRAGARPARGSDHDRPDARRDRGRRLPGADRRGAGGPAGRLVGPAGRPGGCRRRRGAGAVTLALNGPGEANARASQVGSQTGRTRPAPAPDGTAPSDAPGRSAPAARRRRGAVLLGLAVPVAILATWHVASVSGWIDPVTLPGPLSVLAAAGELIERGDLG